MLHFVILALYICVIESMQIEFLTDSKTASLPISVFTNIGQKHPAASDLLEYVPVDSRETYRGEYKKWPKTFDTFLMEMKIRVLPNVKFFQHITGQGEMEIDTWNPKMVNWNSSQETKILIHGYRQNRQSSNMPGQLIQAYDTMNYTGNLVILDWNYLASQEYFEAAMYSQKVGKVLAEFLIVLRNKGLIQSFKSVHIIGFCLGANIAAASADLLKTRAGQSAIIGRITGLDPSGPGFYNSRRELVLDATDADFVDVIHTNGGFNFRDGELGLPQTIGHADFYPNGGRSQPICNQMITITDHINACHHLKACDYYKRSILAEVFRSCRCGSWSSFDTEICSCTNGPYMGEYLQKLIGKFFLHVFEYTLFELFEQEGLLS